MGPFERHFYYTLQLLGTFQRTGGKTSILYLFVAFLSNILEIYARWQKVAGMVNRLNIEQLTLIKSLESKLQIHNGNDIQHNIEKYCFKTLYLPFSKNALFYIDS